MTKRRRPKPDPRRAYYGPEKMRAAFMAGEGFTGQEIADYLGGTTSQRVRAMLRKAGIKMRRSAGSTELLPPTSCTRRDLRALRSCSDDLDVEVSELLILIIRDALAAPEKLRDLVNSLDPEDAD